MKIGIIGEYNPFHNGHIYHINEIKKRYPDSTIILVMSGEYTQRGDINIVNKWDRTKTALNYGVDLVIELPYIYLQSADIFSYGALKILNYLKVDKIIFGSEGNDKNMLIKLANTTLSKEYELKINNYSKEYSYPKACGMALKEITNINLDNPNDILGVCYTKEIIKNNYPIDIETIKRTNNYHDKNLKDIASATSIREAIKQNKNIENYIPKEIKNKINNKFLLDNYFNFIKYKIISTDDLTIYNDIDKNLASRLKKYIVNSYNLEDFIQTIKTKNYTYSKIKRILLYILIDFKKCDNDLELKYIRILGFNKKGRNYLNELKKDIDIPIISNYSNSKGLLNKNVKIINILSLILDDNKQEETINKELTELIRIDE